MHSTSLAPPFTLVMHHFACFPNMHSSFFKQFLLYQFTSSLADLLSDSPHAPFYQFIPHSLNMAEPLKNTFTPFFSFTPFVIPHKSLIGSFGVLSILLIPKNPLRLSICTVLILGLSFSFYISVSLLYRKTGTSTVSCSTLVYPSCRPLV